MSHPVTTAEPYCIVGKEPSTQSPVLWSAPSLCGAQQPSGLIGCEVAWLDAFRLTQPKRKFNHVPQYDEGDILFLLLLVDVLSVPGRGYVGVQGPGLGVN